MRQWLGAFAAVLATTAVLGAQQSQPANTPPPDANAPAGVQRTPPAPAAQTKAASTVTFTGCIEDSPMVTAAVTPPAAAPGATKMYYLNNAKMAADAGAPARSSAVGTSGAAATGYRLEGDTAEISSHLNQQVRVVGTVQSSNASPTGAANAAPGSAAAAGSTLKVESVTMIAAKCEEAK